MRNEYKELDLTKHFNLQPPSTLRDVIFIVNTGNYMLI